MLECPKCGNNQESGKFCGVCGEPVTQGVKADSPPSNEGIAVSNQATTVSSTTAVSQATPTAGTVKNNLSQYGTYFLTILKNPTRAFSSNESHFLQGIITLLLYALTYSLSVYLLITTLFETMVGMMGAFGQGSPKLPFSFFQFNSRLTLYAAVFVAISFGSTLAMIKVAKNTESVKSHLAVFGSLAVPFTVVNVLAMLAGLAGSIKFTLILLGVSSFLLLLLVPVLLVYEKASTVNKAGQNVYISLATVLIILMVNYLIGESIVGGFVEKMEQLGEFMGGF